MKSTITCLCAFFFIAFSFSQVSAQTNYTLHRALQTARANNLGLKAEEFNIQISEADITTARLRANPVLNNQSLQLMRSSLFPENRGWYYNRNRQVWWQLTKSFQIPAQRKHKIQLAQHNHSLAKINYSEIQRNLLYEVATKWVEVWAAQKQMDVITIAKANADTLLRKNKHLYERNSISETDLFRTRILASQHALHYSSTRQALAKKKKELGLLLGIENVISIDTASYFGALPANMDSIINGSFPARSDITAGEINIKAAKTNLKLQEAMAWPAPEVGVIYNPQNSIPYFGVFATWELPFFNRNQGGINKGLMLKEQASQQMLYIRQKVQNEISTAYAEYILNRHNLEIHKDIWAQNRALDIRLKKENTSALSVENAIESQHAWLQEQEEYYNILQAYHQSYVTLLFTTGLINRMAE